MAVPVITNLDNTEGTPSGGYVVTVNGTDFAVQGTDFPAIGEEVPDSVQVTLSNSTLGFSVQAETIKLVSDTSISFIMPKVILITADSPTDDMVLDVTVQNLDSNGDAIPGEVATLTGAFTIKRRCIDGVRLGKIASLAQYLIVLMRSEVHWNVSTVPHTEYDRDTSDPRAQAVKLPHMTLLGPDITLAEAGYQSLTPQVDQGSESFLRVEAPVYYDLAFSLVLVADTSAVIMNMQGALLDFFVQNNNIRVPNDLADPYGPYTEMAMKLTFGPSVEQITSQYSSNLKVARAEFTVYGLPCYEEDVQGCPAPVDIGFTVQDAEVGGQDMGIQIIPIDNKCLNALLEFEANNNP